MGMGGTQRVAKFAKYLPDFGWKPVVLTVKDVHYYAHDPSLLHEVKDVPIFRTESLDPLRLMARFKKIDENTADHPSSKKRKSILNILNEIVGGWLFIPDSKILWLPFAIIAAIKLIRQQKIRVILTTSPPQSAHIGGLILKMLKKVKWVADFRDDWTNGESQPCPTLFHFVINRFLEKIVLKKADKVIGMCDQLTNVLARKHGYSMKKFQTIMNGYDRDDFLHVLNVPLNEKFTITHCGSISKVSNPGPFIAAMRLFFDEYNQAKKQVQIQFIGTDIFGRLEHLLNQYQLAGMIEPIQYLPHHDALKKTMASHLLLITIFKKTDEEIITGKVFEYLGSGKPILLISKPGYVANLIQQLKRGKVVDFENIQGIKDAVSELFNQYQKGRLRMFKPLSVPQFDRENLTAQLAAIFDELVL